MQHNTMGKQFGRAQKQFFTLKNRLRGAGHSALAGAAGAAMVLGNVGRSIHGKAVDLKEHGLSLQKKKDREVFEVKKSTVVALLVALAAVAGVLGALYFYVLRREKELDEYEQLLFSEDFNDDFLDDEDDAPVAEAPKAKA